MTPESSIIRFLEFYLSPFVAQKNIDLLKIEFLKKVKNQKDLGLAEVILIRSTIEFMRKKRKSILSSEATLKRLQNHLAEIYTLAPEDALLLASEPPFNIPTAKIALACSSPIESLEFRKSNLKKQLQKSGVNLDQAFTPIELKTSPLSLTAKPRRSLIQSFYGLPIGVRFTLESSAILVGLMGLLWIIPEVRNRYENSIQKRINDYLIESSLLDAPAPDGTSKTPKAPVILETPEDSKEHDLVNKSSSEEPTTRKQPKVNEGETWRFSFTGASTNEIEDGIINTLKKIPADGAKPITVPGGIQFDFVLETDRLITLKNTLETMVGDLQRKSITSKSKQIASSVNMSWYKKRNMGTRKIPSAHVQVIIWISTL